MAKKPQARLKKNSPKKNIVSKVEELEESGKTLQEEGKKLLTEDELQRLTEEAVAKTMAKVEKDKNLGRGMSKVIMHTDVTPEEDIKINSEELEDIKPIEEENVEVDTSSKEEALTHLKKSSAENFNKIKDKSKETTEKLKQVYADKMPNIKEETTTVLKGLRVMLKKLYYNVKYKFILLYESIKEAGKNDEK